MFLRAHLTRTLSLTLLLAALCGCSTAIFSPYQDPQVRLLRVEVVKAKLLQQDFKLHFQIDNPSGRSLLVRGLDYKVKLNNVVLAEGESSEWFVVGGHEHRQFVVPVRTNLWQHLKYIAKLLKKPNEPVHYRLDGELATGFLFRHTTTLGRNGEITPAGWIQAD